MRYRGISLDTGKALEIRIEQSVIREVREIEFSKDLPYLTIGFFDLQINGHRGIDYSGEDLTPEKVLEVCHSVARTGTTRHLATIITRPRERILANLRVLTEARKQYPFVRDSIVGVHLEGPFISEEDGPRGAHNRDFVRDPDIGEFEEWQDAAEGTIRLVTLAPERKGAIPFIQHLRQRGVVAAIGHTGASAEIIQEAIRSGASLSTHLGNGSHAQIPRLRNYIWEQLAADELYASFICDGFHLPPSVMKVFTRAKGIERIILVSDVAFLAGLKPGFYKWGHLDVELHPDGRITQVGTPFFAGAGHLLDRGIAQFVKHTGSSLSMAIRTCTVNPAKLTGIPESFFNLKVGVPAHLVLFDHPKEDDTLRIHKVVVNEEELDGAKKS
ncbi:MAG: amidohydrolase family protein [Spirochaetes bacterium]|nr:amidohydrolase family protein [Spirochaetota bacterium]